MKKLIYVQTSKPGNLLITWMDDKQNVGYTEISQRDYLEVCYYASTHTAAN